MLEKIVAHTAPLMPVDKPRYLMGVGLPEDLASSVERGMDMFDCVIPTRYAREGTVFAWDGKLRIQDKKYRKDNKTLNGQESTLSSEISDFLQPWLRYA